MFRKRRRRGNIIAWCFILLLIGFTYGYFANNDTIPNNTTNDADKPEMIAYVNDNNKKNNQEINNNNNESIEENPDDDIVAPVLSDDFIITNNTKFFLITYYEKTRDTITNEEKIPDNFIGRSLEEFEDYLIENYNGWNIREINKDKVELYRVLNQASPNHYIVKEYNGYITIFQIDSEGNMKLINQTEIPLSILSDIDRQKMEEGIIVKGIDGINQILEDFSS